MTHPAITKHLEALAVINETTAELEAVAARQLDIMKEIVDRFNMPELRLDKRLSSLFNFDYIKIEVYGNGDATVSLWTEPAGDWGEERIDEFRLNENFLAYNVAEFRVEFEAEVTAIAKGLRALMAAHRQAEIAQARATLERLERLERQS